VEKKIHQVKSNLFDFENVIVIDTNTRYKILIHKTMFIFVIPFINWHS